MRRPLSLTAPLLAVLASSLILAACGTGDSDDDDAAGGGASSGAVNGGPGVDVAAKTIRIGDINALTGPASALGKPVAAGHRAFFKSLNASGGIDGWKVRLTIKDSGYPPQQHVQIYRAIRNDVALLNSFGSPPTKAIQALLDKDKLVTTPASFDSIWGDDPAIAAVGTPYSYDIANVLDYYTKSGDEKPKIGIIYQNDEYGQDGLRGYTAAAKELGFDDVSRQTFKAGDTEFTAQIQKLKSAGAEAVVVVVAAEQHRPDHRHRRDARLQASVDPPGPGVPRAAHHQGRLAEGRADADRAGAEGGARHLVLGGLGRSRCAGDEAGRRRPRQVRARRAAEHLLRAGPRRSEGPGRDPAQGDQGW